VSDDGTVTFLDSNEQPLSSYLVDKAKREKGEQIRGFIERQCAKFNEETKQLGEIHLHTPKPTERIQYKARDFDILPPVKPAPTPHGLLGWLFESTRTRIDAQNVDAAAMYQKTLTEWQGQKATFEADEAARKHLLEERVYSEVDAMETILEGALAGIAWPRETKVSAEVRQSGQLAMLDVDLPEIEDMPKKTASYPSRGYRINMKEMPAAQRQRLYMQHVHAIGFRVIGETFAVLPKAFTVILSAYSQRPNKATGAIGDEYLYSVSVRRSDWAMINFDNLAALDVVSALERFELRRDMTKAGAFHAIEPISAPA